MGDAASTAKSNFIAASQLEDDQFLSLVFVQLVGDLAGLVPLLKPAAPLISKLLTSQLAISLASKLASDITKDVTKAKLASSGSSAANETRLQDAAIASEAFAGHSKMVADTQLTIRYLKKMLDYVNLHRTTVEAHIAIMDELSATLPVWSMELLGQMTLEIERGLWRAWLADRVTATWVTYTSRVWGDYSTSLVTHGLSESVRTYLEKRFGAAWVHAELSSRAKREVRQAPAGIGSLDNK